PHGGHSKSPNSSNFKGAFAGPATCAGSTPGTPVSTGCCDSAGEACEPGDAGGWFAGGLFCAPGIDRVRYQALLSATARTTRMMMKGSIRFISLIGRVSKLPLRRWPPVSGRYHDHHSILAGPHTHVPGGALNRAHSVRDYKFPRYCHGSRSDFRRW